MASDDVVILEDAAPLLICVMPPDVTPRVVDQMATLYEQLFTRGDRYALISCNVRGGGGTPAKERRLIADWASSPRVRSMSAKLCVGSATVVEAPLQRAALTAILWFWTPASPHHTASDAADAVRYCFERIDLALLPKPALSRERAIQLVNERIRG